MYFWIWLIPFHFPVNRPFHGFFNFWHGPVRENPCQHRYHWKERLNISRTARFRYSSAPQRCENLQTLIWSTVQTPGKFRDFEVTYQAWDAELHHEMKNREDSWTDTKRSGVFLTNFEVLHLVTKHGAQSVEWLILRLKRNDFRRRNQGSKNEQPYFYTLIKH